MPPPRAVSEGTNGASTRPAPLIEYPSVSGLRPNRPMNRYATRIPNRVDVTAVANRNAVKISHTVGLAYPEKTWAGESVLVKASVAIATSVKTGLRRRTRKA